MQVAVRRRVALTGVVAIMVPIVATSGTQRRGRSAWGASRLRQLAAESGSSRGSEAGAAGSVRDAEEASDGEILVEIGPVDAEPAADQLPAPSGLGGSVPEPRKPLQGDGQ